MSFKIVRHLYHFQSIIITVIIYNLPCIENGPKVNQNQEEVKYIRAKYVCVRKPAGQVTFRHGVDYRPHDAPMRYGAIMHRDTIQMIRASTLIIQ